MSRTRKGSKGPGWEPWSNSLEKQEQRADYVESSEGGEVSRIEQAIEKLRVAKRCEFLVLSARHWEKIMDVLADADLVFESHNYGHSSYADLANDTLGIALTALADEVLT